MQHFTLPKQSEMQSKCKASQSKAMQSEMQHFTLPKQRSFCVAK